MKKLITFFVIYLILSLNYTFGAVCSIEEETATFLDEYIKNSKEAINKINYEAKRNETLKTQISKLRQKIVGIYNKIYGVDYYVTSVKYAFELPKNIQVPEAVKRDFEKLKQNGEYISDTLEEIILSGKGESEINNFCKNFSGLNCNISNNIKTYNLLIQIAQNQRNIETIFLKQIVGDNVGKKSLILVKNGFYTEMKKYYSPQAYSKCNEKEGTFFSNVMKQSSDIFKTNTSVSDGIQEWKNAWNLLLGIDMSEEEQQKIEENLLKQKLNEDGVSTKNQKNILNSLAEFNQNGWYSRNNNFVSNTFYNVKKAVKDSVSEIREELLGDFIEENKNKDGEVPIQSITKARNNLIITNNTQEKIESFYANNSIFAVESNINSANLKARLINTHLYMKNAIDILSIKSCPKSVKICNQQDYGRGKCGECK